MSILDTIQQQPDDPIIKLIGAYNADTRANKVNLGVGVYKDDLGETPIFSSIKEVEKRLVEEQKSKEYVGILGDVGLIQEVGALLFPNKKFGEDYTGAQGLGGSGALRLIAEFIHQADPKATIWVPKPTWGNHFALFGAAGVQCKEYTWKSTIRDNLVEDAIASLDAAKEGDVVVLHACCHNPTGIDASDDQLQQILDVLKQKKLVPFVDAAYLGFRDGFAEDVSVITKIADQFETIFCAFSASKNFAMYRERVGVAFVTGSGTDVMGRCKSQLMSSARSMYSMPADHGAACVRMVLQDEALRQNWLKELEEARQRILKLRHALTDALLERQFSGELGHVKGGSGLFCMLPVTPDHVDRLREEYGIYMVSNGRVNIAGLAFSDIDPVAEAIAHVKAGG